MHLWSLVFIKMYCKHRLQIFKYSKGFTQCPYKETLMQPTTKMWKIKCSGYASWFLRKLYTSSICLFTVMGFIRHMYHKWKFYCVKICAQNVIENKYRAKFFRTPSYITFLDIIFHPPAMSAQQGSFLNAIMTLILDFLYETWHWSRCNLTNIFICYSYVNPVW